ncbi:MAG: oligoendopeptidase F [Lachnospiraceae bacterium]|nr:oligoendopeptidase F [Lachnospiraceae bacterium]
MGAQLKKRSEIEEKYKWNLEDLIPSKEALNSLLKEAEEGISVYKTYQGRLGSSAAVLAEFLAFDGKLDEVFSRLFAYAQQKSDEDTTVGEFQALLSRVGTLSVRAMEAAAFVEPEILAIPETVMEEFLNTAELSHYRLHLKRILAKKEHMLTEAEERILSAASGVTQAPSDIFRMFNNADIRFPVIDGENGEKIEVTHGRFIKLLSSRDRSVREAAFHAYYSVYRQYANTVAAMYEGNVKQACFFAKMRKYGSSREYYLSENEIPEQVYENLLKAVEENLPLLHRYVSIRKRELGVDTLHMYDLYAPLTEDYERTVPFEEAKELILEGLKPLGEEYAAILRQGFSGRWIDVYENQGKRSGGYSNSVYGVHPYVLMSYEDTMDSVLTLAHEMGHSLHSWYSGHSQTSTYAHYKIFVAEVASTCNEVLLLRHLINRAESAAEKKFLLNQFLEKFRGTFFRQALFAEFEWKSHRMCQEEIPLTKDALCKLYHDLNVKYFGEDMVVDSDIDYEWERIPHFYRPFYVYQYSTGFAAATAIAGRILEGDQKTLNGYFEFLKGGCSMTPVELLMLCGIDMEKPEVVGEALRVFEQLLDEFEACR